MVQLWDQVQFAIRDYGSFIIETVSLKGFVVHP